MQRKSNQQQPGQQVFSLSQRELNTILAALRFWQVNSEVIAEVGDILDPYACMEIATNCDTDAPLGDDEIDQLCDRLNVAEGGAA